MRSLRTLLRSSARSAALALLGLLPGLASAHEVYVLTSEQIESGLSAPRTTVVSVVMQDPSSFLFWGAIAALVIVAIFLLSLSRALERACRPFFMRIKHYAPAVARVTIGVSFLAAAYYQALFGPELPLSVVFGPFASVVTALLVVIGVLVIIGWRTRLAAGAALLLFAVAVVEYGSYMLTYTNYLGEIAVLLIVGPHRLGADRFRSAAAAALHPLDAFAKKLAPYSFLILRIAFGISLIYASYYAKFLHSELAYEVASLPLAGHAFGLAHYFHMEPHFLVLGAGIVELLIGAFILLGIEMRFTALFLEFWLALSLVYFGEVVWPHLILIGIPIALFMYGYDRYSVEGWLFKSPDRDPVF
ncbi:MAG TPA: DoxX family membrane protein [Candidatus Paceibacterota bacterium]|nr:DoxX family membrane protein [Candidatus Paceibacterota bacterium]